MQELRQEKALSLRPQSFEEFVGQDQVVQNLKVFLKAAQMRGEALDHVLLSGPPGLGKTTLAQLLSSYQGGNFYQIAAPHIRRAGDLVKLLSLLEERDILFIDEIHRLSAPIEEILYMAMEDREIDIPLGEGLATKVVKLNLPAFTLAGATTRPGALSNPLRERFGIKLRLHFYNLEELVKILERAAWRWQISYDEGVLAYIAMRSRRTPRIALALLRRIWDFALVDQQKKLSLQLTQKGFAQLGIDDLGLTELDRELLRILAEDYGGGPAGLKALASALGEDTETIENFMEPYLVQLGLLKRTPRGRVITVKAQMHLKTNPTLDLFEEFTGGNL